MLENSLHENLTLRYEVDIQDKPFRSFSKTVFVKFFDENHKLREEFKLGYISPEEIFTWIDEGKDINLNNAYIKNFSLLDYRVEKGLDDSVPVKLQNISAKKAFFDCDLKTDFSFAEFAGEKTLFEQAVFANGIADFNHAAFGDGDVNFKKCKFGAGTVNFQFATFGSGIINFNTCCFGQGNILFVSTDFGNGNVDFKNTIWGDGHVDFKFAKFSDGDITFERALFGKGKKDFKNLEFGGGKIDFRRVNFNDGDVSFEGVEFGTGKVMFRSALFGHGEKSFDEADFGQGEVQFDQVEFGSGKLSFHLSKADVLSFHGCGLNLFVDMRMASCNNIVMSNTIVRDIVDFEPEDEEIHIKTLNIRGMRILGRLFIDFRVNKVKTLIYSQTDTSLFQKAEQFRLLKENFRNNGQYEDEDASYIEFKRCESKAELEDGLQTNKFKIPPYFIYYFQKYVFDYVGRYGTAPTRVLANMVISFTVFSLIYFLFSISDTLSKYGHIVAGGAETLSLNHESVSVLEAFGNSLYYSGITFFTVGYGDYFANGLLKPVAVFEGFTGVFLMSYFTVAFVRKILR